MTFSFSLGEWQNGHKHGKGVEQTTEGTYEGEWKDNMVNKNPTLTWILTLTGVPSRFFLWPI